MNNIAPRRPPIRIRDNEGLVQPSKRLATDWNKNRTTFEPSDPRYFIYGTPRKESMIRLATDTPPGHFVELGVYQGGTAWRLARLAALQGRECHLFDTFCGIPECTFGIDIIPIGKFADTNIEYVKKLIPTAIYHVGVFPNTMCDLGPLAFVHLDCDQYRTYLAAIDHFYPLLVPGGILLADDYNVTPGAKKAMDDTFGSNLMFTREGKAYIKKQ